MGMGAVGWGVGLAERVGGLDAEMEWGHVLSLGEQQRVAFLRLLLHRPVMSFLDEATGALDTPTEAVLYTALRRYCPCYISIGTALPCASRCFPRSVIPP